MKAPSLRSLAVSDGLAVLKYQVFGPGRIAFGDAAFLHTSYLIPHTSEVE